MPDPTGRWLNGTQWQCPKCAWVSDAAHARCQKCGGSERPAQGEPVRPPDPLDLIGYDPSKVGNEGPVELATRAIHRLSRVTREKAMAVFGQGLRTGLKGHGEQADRAWQAIAEMPESDQRAALGSVVDGLEQEGFALYSIREDERG